MARAVTLADLPGATVALDTGTDATPALETLALTDLTLLIGAEREGLPADLIEACDHVARIPIVSHSLNAAMAATVALYEASRMAR